MELRKYQEEDVQSLLTRDAMGVFNEQRTGKTPTSIITMCRRGVTNLIIVCPASMSYKWAEEYRLWSGKSAQVITSVKKCKELSWDNGAIIINYENLRDNKARKGLADRLLKLKPEGIIVDEAHRIKGRRTANALAVFKFRKVPYKLALTGTPAPNKPWDIWSILHFLYPTVFQSYWNFIDEYFIKQALVVPGQIIDKPIAFKPDMQIHLQNQLKHISIMRKRKDVMPWLPKEESPTIIKLPCTRLQEKYIHELENYFRTAHINTQSILEQLVRIRQVCAAPAILGLRGRSPKIDWLEQYVKDYPEKSIIVFSNSKKFIQLVAVRVKCVVITGDTPTKLRHTYIEMFQTGAVSVIVIQTQAGKEGLTLDKADATIFLDTYPPAADYLQAKDRMVATTPDKVKPKEIIHLMMKGTYDERLYALVNKGIAETDVINDYINYLKGGN